jgi:DHA3 family macrolide efflux protein-like MFS transporter
MAAPTPQLSVKEVLRERPVRRLWIAQMVSVFGDFLALFAIFAIVTFQLHGTPTQVAMIMVSFLLPLAVISPLAGVFVDKWNVKTTMITSDVIRGLLVITLIFVRDLNVIYATFFLLATVSAFFIPAQSVAVRTLAPANGLLSVNALMTQAVQGIMIVSPGIAGLLVDGVGANACFIFDSMSFFVSAGLVASLTIRREAAPATTQARTVLQSLGQGFHFIFTHAAISFVMIAMTAGMFALRCFGALLSVYVRDVLVSNARLFGLLNSLIGIGMIIGSQFIRKFAQKTTHQLIVIYGLAGMGLSVLITALFGMVASTAAGMLGLGVCIAFIMVTAQTLIQRETPAPMLGRVSSSLMSLLAIAQVLAMLVAGPVAQKAGIRNLYFGSAAMLFAMALFGYTRIRRSEPAEAAAA